jgi:Ca-activated chloride channel family protein
MAVGLLDSRDIVSIVTYSDSVSVLVPATRATNTGYLRERISSIYADGSTALFAGVSKGADELMKFFDRNRVNRVILLSDGLANVGPDSPAALGDLGASLRKSGISVTTIGLGLGYNEDLMVRLAEKSDGNHAFVENSRDLARVFEFEFGDILSVVAQDVEIEINCGAGIKPIRMIGREAEIIGSNVVTTINQLYSGQEKYVVLEVEVEPHPESREITLADVLLRYDNMLTKRQDLLSGGIQVGFTASRQQVEENVNRPAMESAILQIATERSEEAIDLRDKGLVQEAQEVMRANSEFLQENAAVLESEELAGYGASMAAGAEAIEDDEEWNATRKQMIDDQHEKRSQQSY